MVYAAICLAPARAVAAPPASAKDLYERGVAAFNAHDWDTAVQDLKQCYAMTKQPILLFDLAQAYRLSGASDIAYGYYEEFLQKAGPDDPSRPQAQVFAEEIGQKLHLAPLPGSEGAGAATAQKATNTTTAAKPGAGTTTGAGETAHAITTPPLAPAPASSTPWTHDALGLSLVGVGVAALAAGAGLVVYGTHEVTSASYSQPLADYENQRKGGLQLRQIGAVTLVGGGLVAAGGVVRLLLVRAHGEEPVDTGSQHAALDVTPTGFCLHGTF